jgi:hypothetical protein
VICNLVRNRNYYTLMRASLLAVLMAFAMGCGQKTTHVNIVINDVSPSGLYLVLLDAEIHNTDTVQFSNDRTARAPTDILKNWTSISLYNKDRSIKIAPMLGTPNDTKLMFYKIIFDQNKMWIFIGNYTDYTTFIATPKHSLAGHTLSIP